jgi:signal transduction histidine kinase
LHTGSIPVLVDEGRLGATGGREGSALRGDRGGGLAERADVVDAFIALLVRALDLERVLFLVADTPGRPLRCVGAHGPVSREPVPFDGVPPGAPWSASFPIDFAGRVGGLLLLGRSNEAPLEAGDYALARQLAAGAGAILESAGLAADLEHARTLLQRADRLSALGTLAAGVAHEIRNPLVSVRTFIQLLPERVDDEEFRTSFRELALKEIERICELITDLLAFSRPSPADREPSDLNQIASQIVRLLDPEARKRDVAITAEFASHLPIVVVHEAQIKQVLMNVVLNAIQACAGRGTVSVVTRATGRDAAVVEIADTGAGIAPDLRDQIFDPFFTTKDNGSGLGLYIAHRIVTEHGGTIQVRPHDDRGTVFTITFHADPERPHGARG